MFFIGNVSIVNVKKRYIKINFYKLWLWFVNVNGLYVCDMDKRFWLNGVIGF